MFMFENLVGGANMMQAINIFCDMQDKTEALLDK
jgi:hypothetical protein